MRSLANFQFPPEQGELRDRARRLAWLSIVMVPVAGVVVFATTGQSQTMKTAWITDLLSIIPSAALVLAMRYELRPPTKRFPFGHFRAIAISFLLTASVLLLMGVMLLLDALMKLVRQQRPPIGTMVIAGHQLWAGWPMIGALSLGDLMDEAPTHLGKHTLEDLPLRVQAAALQLSWVKAARVRFREHGHLITGDVMIVPATETVRLPEIEDAVERVHALDWRLHGVTVVPTTELETTLPS
jgi:divalent metal cation (Fe/Co/Zn/Cd) transporter